MRPSSLALLFAPLLACTEYGIQDKNADANADQEDGEPDIVLDPASVDFGEVDVTGTEFPVQAVTVSNVGTAALKLESIRIADAGAPYTYSALSAVILQPDETAEFAITFTPLTAGTFDSKVLVDSNDPDTPTAPVDVTGVGLAPQIDLSPDSDDFGAPYIGCRVARPLTITNTGNSPLIVDDIDFTTASYELSLDIDDGDDGNGALPWTIAPDDSRVVYVEYMAEDEIGDNAYVSVSSNDPAQPVATATQRASGTLAGEKRDTFEQPVRSSVDILWVVDNSGSMSEEQTSLADNAKLFMEQMVAVDADYRVAVITTDRDTLRGDVIMPETADPVGEFQTQATPGTMGSGDEMGSEFARRCLDGGDCAEGGDFWREDSRLEIVYVTDETDSSKMSSGWEWTDYLSFFQGLKKNPDDVTINAIAGDYPSGCHSTSGDAYPGVGYYEQVTATDGLYLSICELDWSTHLTALGEEAANQKSSFVLSELPVPETIVVVVDGITQYSGWDYDDGNNAVQFDDDHIPAGGATITVDYALYGDCEE